MKLRWEDMVNRSTVTLATLVLMLGVLLAARTFIPQQALPTTAQRVQAEPITEEAASHKTNTGDFFVDFRLQREQARAEEIKLLDSIIERKDAPQQSVKEADTRKIELTRSMEQERMIEKLLIAKGFEDAAAFVLEDSLTVAVKKAELVGEDTAKILDIALHCTGLEADKVKIVPVAPE